MEERERADVRERAALAERIGELHVAVVDAGGGVARNLSAQPWNACSVASGVGNDVAAVAAEQLVAEPTPIFAKRQPALEQVVVVREIRGILAGVGLVRVRQARTCRRSCRASSSP